MDWRVVRAVAAVSLAGLAVKGAAAVYGNYSANKVAAEVFDGYRKAWEAGYFRGRGV